MHRMTARRSPDGYEIPTCAPKIDAPIPAPDALDRIGTSDRL